MRDGRGPFIGEIEMYETEEDFIWGQKVKIVVMIVCLLLASL